MDLDKAIQGRRSVRKFKLKKPDWRDIIEAIEVMKYTPMSGGNFSLKVILVSDEDKIKKLADYCEQDFVNQAKYVVIVCSEESRTKNLYPENFNKFLNQQAGAAIQNFLLKLQEYKLSSCWIGHFMEDKVKDLLDINGDVNVEGIFPIGYEFKKPLIRKAKTDLNRFLYFDFYRNKRMNKSWRSNPI